MRDTAHQIPGMIYIYIYIKNEFAIMLYLNFSHTVYAKITLV